MVGRKLSTSALVGSLAAVAALGGCRDRATTGPSDIPSRSYAANLRPQGGDVQTGPVALPLPVPLSVKVVDAGGNVVQGASVNWVVLSGGGSVIPPTGVSDALGMVRTSWTLGTALGGNKVRAFLYGAYILDSATFTATAVNGAAATIVLADASKPPATLPVATALPAMVYTVSDAFGHPVPGVTVSFATGFNSGTVNPTSASTDSSGKVSTIWTTGTMAGISQSVSATLPGQLPVVSVLNITTPDTSRRLMIVSGSNQTTPVSGALPQPLVVQITDRFNNPITGDLVTFNDSLINGGSVLPTTARTDVTGMASTRWTVGPLAGPLRMRVRIDGSGGQFVRFSSNATVQFRDVFAGDYFVCGVTTSDRAYCWGYGQDGQLGSVAAISRNAPSWPVTRVDTIAGPFPTFRDVSGGKSHSCGVTIARSLLCWGFSPDGRAFITPGSAFAIPAAPPVSSVQAVTTGESFSCYITLAGFPACVGTNEVGETGVLGAPPVPQTFSFITAGQRHSCGMPRLDPSTPATLLASRRPWCWGLNDNGQLGDGTFVNSLTPVPLPALVLPAVTFDSLSIVAGTAHTCALASFAPGVGGAAYCWGSNTSGQLGDGTLPPFAPGLRSAVPVAVAGGNLFVRLFAGNYHTCGLTATGAAYCWGGNSSGQLGNGTTQLSSTPTAVAGGLTFSSLAMGELHSCGITGSGPGVTGTTGVAGTIYCWGDNEYGQLGQGVFGQNASPSLTPVRVVYQQ